MTPEASQFLELVLRAARGGILRKLVFSQPTQEAPAPRQSGKLCLLRGRRVLVMESAFEGGRVSQKLYEHNRLAEELSPLLSLYRQANLLTSAGEATLMTSRKGKTTLIGGPRLSAALDGGLASFTQFDLPIDRQKQRLLTGGEPFLAALGIADRQGRVHDKRQAKFRQINRFLEHLSELYDALPQEGPLSVYDLCCGKSYLSFAVYHYLTAVKGRELRMVCIDRKQDVIEECAGIAAACGFTGMSFIAGDVRHAVPTDAPDLVVSLHACDVATDIVLERAVALGAGVILSTPCCHRYVGEHIECAPLSFVTDHPQLRGKLCEALTDGLRLLYLEMNGYTVTAAELTDPENTPKNTLLRAIRRPRFDRNGRGATVLRARYEAALAYLLGSSTSHYPEEI